MKDAAHQGAANLNKVKTVPVPLTSRLSNHRTHRYRHTSSHLRLRHLLQIINYFHSSFAVINPNLESGVGRLHQDSSTALSQELQHRCGPPRHFLQLGLAIEPSSTESTSRPPPTSIIPIGDPEVLRPLLPRQAQTFFKPLPTSSEDNGFTNLPRSSLTNPTARSPCRRLQPQPSASPRITAPCHYYVIRRSAAPRDQNTTPIDGIFPLNTFARFAPAVLCLCSCTLAVETQTKRSSLSHSLP